MQKDMIKAFDQELSKNGLVRIIDPLMKSENSIFRAISMCLYYNHSDWDKVQSYMRLCGLASCELSATQNPFPIIPSRSKYIHKFQDWKTTAKDYFTNPDLQCFQKENLEMASLVFDAQVELYCLTGTSDQFYLQTTIINLGKTSGTSFLRDRVPSKKLIRIGKINNRYYGILSQQKNKMISFIRDYISYSLTNPNNPPNNTAQVNKIQHYPHYEQTHPHNRQHKKSLSDYGDLNTFNDAQFDENQPQFNLNKNKYQIENPSKIVSQEPIMVSINDHDTMFINQSIPINPVDETLINTNLHSIYNPMHYIQYSPYDYGQYPSLSHSHSHSEPLEQQPSYTLCNNCQYQGRLKFFDQNKNYGFIVVDEINEDLFVHLDDLSKAGISKDALKNNVEMRFQFTCLEYDGKYKKSKKAVDLLLLP